MSKFKNIDNVVSNIPSLSLDFLCNKDHYKKIEVFRDGEEIGELQLSQYPDNHRKWDIDVWGNEGHEGKVKSIYNDTVIVNDHQELVDMGLPYLANHKP